MALVDLGRYDLGGIGASAYTDRAAALALAGAMSIVRASLILDSFGGNDREFLIYGISGASASAVPEPTSMILLGAGLAGLAAARRKRPHAGGRN